LTSRILGFPTRGRQSNFAKKDRFFCDPFGQRVQFVMRPKAEGQAERQDVNNKGLRFARRERKKATSRLPWSFANVRLGPILGVGEKSSRQRA